MRFHRCAVPSILLMLSLVSAREYHDQLYETPIAPKKITKKSQKANKPGLSLLANTCGGGGGGGGGGDTDDTCVEKADECVTGNVSFCLETQAEFVEDVDSADYDFYLSPPWAIWWASQFDYTADSATLVGMLDEVRCRSLNELDMQDPPNFDSGVYYNVYLHRGDEDFFPTGWGNGQGTNSYDMPYLTLPDGAHLEPSNVHHEAFHVFQYSASAPGYQYAGDSGWYVEATAQWYHAYATDGANDEGFIEIGAIPRNPHIAMWHSFDNGAPDDHTEWLYGVKQYAMHAFLWYLTGINDVANNIIVEGFYGESQTLLPQEYLYANIPNLRDLFADWAAAATNKFDYLTRAQYERGELEVEILTPDIVDPDDINELAYPMVTTGTDNDEVRNARPPTRLYPRGWAWNVILLNNTEAVDNTYTFTLTGNSTGSEGAASYFRLGAVLVTADDGSVDTNIKSVGNMTSDTEGYIEVDIDANTELVYFIVISMPEHFEGYQTYEYEFSLVPEV